MTRPLNGEQLKLDWNKDAAIEEMIEARAVERAEALAFSWRLRLVAIETMSMTGLVMGSGWFLKQPTPDILGAGLIVATFCFVGGMLLIGITGLLATLVTRFRQWRQRS